MKTIKKILDRLFIHYRTTVAGIIAIGMGGWMMHRFIDSPVVVTCATGLITAGIGLISARDTIKSKSSNSQTND